MEAGGREGLARQVVDDHAVIHHLDLVHRDLVVLLLTHQLLQGVLTVVLLLQFQGSGLLTEGHEVAEFLLNSLVMSEYLLLEGIGDFYALGLGECLVLDRLVHHQVHPVEQVPQVPLEVVVEEGQADLEGHVGVLLLPPLVVQQSLPVVQHTVHLGQFGMHLSGQLETHLFQQSVGGLAVFVFEEK